MADFNTGECVSSNCPMCNDFTPHVYLGSYVWQCLTCNDIKFEALMPEVHGIRIGRFGHDISVLDKN